MSTIRIGRTSTSAFAVISCALALAACGSSSKSNTDARLSSQGLRFSTCMRAHGITNFPDPSSTGELAISPSSGMNPFSPAFQSAQKACGGGPNNRRPAQMSERQKLAALHFAECMRAHGVPNFPDPEEGAALPNGPVLALRGMLFAGTAALNPSSEAFKHAAVACGVRLP